MIDKVAKRTKKKEYFFYLGKQFDLVYLNNNGLMFGEEKVFIDPNFDIDKWYKWQRKCIKEEITSDSFELSFNSSICSGITSSMIS